MSRPTDNLKIWQHESEEVEIEPEKDKSYLLWGLGFVAGAFSLLIVEMIVTWIW